MGAFNEFIMNAINYFFGETSIIGNGFNVVSFCFSNSQRNKCLRHDEHMYLNQQTFGIINLHLLKGV